MTQEDKDLLIKDLCARLSCGVKVDHFGIIRELLGVVPSSGNVMVGYDINDYEDSVIEDIKPYLRPISSMTDEEMDKLFDILKIDKDGKDEDWIKINDILGIEFFFPTGRWVENVAEAYDYLYLIHIDFRGLIPIGLALEAEEGMYKPK